MAGPKRHHIPLEDEVRIAEERLGDPQASRALIAIRAESTEDRVKAVEKRILERNAEMAERIAPVTKDTLERRVSERLAIIDAFLTTDKIIEKLEKANLKDIGIYEGILMDKLAAIRGAPAANMSPTDHAKVDQLLPALMEVMKQRGITATATERKVEFTSGPQPDPRSVESVIQRGPDPTGPATSGDTGPGAPV